VVAVELLAAVELVPVDVVAVVEPVGAAAGVEDVGVGVLDAGAAVELDCVAAPLGAAAALPREEVEVALAVVAFPADPVEFEELVKNPLCLSC
jgi:hypothetical protein